MVFSAAGVSPSDSPQQAKTSYPTPVTDFEDILGNHSCFAFLFISSCDEMITYSQKAFGNLRD